MSFQTSQQQVTTTPYQIFVLPTQYLTGYIKAFETNTVTVNVSIVRYSLETIPIQLIAGAKLNFENFNCQYVYIYTNSSTAYVEINLVAQSYVSGNSRLYVEAPPEPTYISPEAQVNIYTKTTSYNRTYSSGILTPSPTSTTSATPVLVASFTFTPASNVTKIRVGLTSCAYVSAGTGHQKLTVTPAGGSETLVNQVDITNTSAIRHYVADSVLLTVTPNVQLTFKYYMWIDGTNTIYEYSTTYRPVYMVWEIEFNYSYGGAVYTLTQNTPTLKQKAIYVKTTVSTSGISSFTLNMVVTSENVAVVTQTPSTTLQEGLKKVNSLTLYVTNNNNDTIDASDGGYHLPSTGSATTESTASGSVTINFTLTLNAYAQLYYLPAVKVYISGALTGSTTEATIISGKNFSVDNTLWRLAKLECSASANTTVKIYVNGNLVASYNIPATYVPLDLGYQFLLNPNDTFSISYIQGTAGNFSANLDVEVMR